MIAEWIEMGNVAGLFSMFYCRRETKALKGIHFGGNDRISIPTRVLEKAREPSIKTRV